MRNEDGVQTKYPAIAKVVARSPARENEDGSQTIPVYYGSGAYVSEYGPWGIVLTNWHVVSAASESIEVIFPRGSSPARVILKDVKWDLAALVIRKPSQALPIPISLDVPKCGERLWPAGYGPTAGLTGFQIQSGALENYVALGDPADETPKDGAQSKDGPGAGDSSANVGSGDAGEGVEKTASKAPKSKPLYETEAIGVAVRCGDSGGPILNQYGELAGLLWGSDKRRSTMGTSSVRLQVFLTQAIREAARLRAERALDCMENGGSPDDFLAAQSSGSYPDALLSETPMIDAVTYEGVFPISTRPVYRAGNGIDTPKTLRAFEKISAMNHTRKVAEIYWKSNVDGLPPSPPIFSPTFVEQQRQTGQDRPELIEDDGFAALDAAAMEKAKRERELIYAEEPAYLAENSDAAPTIRQTAFERQSSPTLQTKGTTEEAKLASATTKKSKDGFKDGFLSRLFSSPTTATQKVTAARTDVAPKNREAGAANEHAPNRDGRQISSIEAYAVVFAIFCLFFFAARGFRDTTERKNAKSRLRKES